MNDGNSCLDSLPKSMCPLCRTGFEAGDIRRLHIDRAQTPLTPTDPSRPDPDGESSQEAHRYQTDITRIVKAGAPASELRALIDNCHLWLKSQPHDQVINTIFTLWCVPAANVWILTA